MYVLCCRRRSIGKSEDRDSESVWERGDQLFTQLRQQSFTAILNLSIQRAHCNLAENLNYLKNVTTTKIKLKSTNSKELELSDVSSTKKSAEPHLILYRSGAT